MNEQPRGRTGERCKEDGTYASPAGAKQYVNEGTPFPPCPVTGKETDWERVT